MKTWLLALFALLTSWFWPPPAIDLEPALADAAGAIAYASLATAPPLPPAAAKPAPRPAPPPPLYYPRGLFRRR